MAVKDERDTYTVGGIDYEVYLLELDDVASTSTWVARRRIVGKYVEMGRYVAADTETLANAVTALIGTPD